MSSIKNGRHYREVSSRYCFRILDVLPDRDVAIAVRVDCESTRPESKKLSDLNDQLIDHQIIPVERTDETPLPDGTRSPASQVKFENLKPALEELMAYGYVELAERKIWSDIKRLASRIGVSASTLNAAFSRVLMAGGVIDAAIPRYDKCGRVASSGKKGYVPRPTRQPNSFHLQIKDLENIASGVTKFLQGEQTWEEAHDDFLEHYYPTGEKMVGDEVITTVRPVGERPSFFQFKYHGKRQIPFLKLLEQRVGRRKVDTDHRGRPKGQSGPAIYPGTVAEIDWTIADIVAVARGNRLSIGRMTIYAIADVFSGAIISVYLTMGNGSSWEAGRAVLECLEDNVEKCSRVGLNIEGHFWINGGLPTTLRCDRGEIDSWKSTGLGTALGMNLEFCPARRPDTKGTIESFFRVVRWNLRRMRGGTSGQRERLKDHPNVTAIYDFEQVQKLLYILAIRYNTRTRRRQAMTPGMVADGVLPVANAIYDWGKRNGCIRDFPIEKARMGVLPAVFANLTEEGIKIQGLRYVLPDIDPKDPEGIEANEWLAQAKGDCRKVEVGIDSASVNFVWLRYRPPNGPTVCTKCLLSAEHSGWHNFSWAEYGIHRKRLLKEISCFKEGHAREIRTWAGAAVARVTRTATDQTEPMREGMSARAQIAGAAERRANEQRLPAKEPDVLEKQPDVIGIPGDQFFDPSEWPTAI